MSLHENIRSLRKEKHLSQKELAKLVNVSSQVISNWERNYTTPNADDISRLAKVLNTSTEKLLDTGGNTDLVSDKKGEYQLSDRFNPMEEINNLLTKYNLDQSGFFDIENWKAMGPDEIKELESYFEYISSKAKKKQRKDEPNDRD